MVNERMVYHNPESVLENETQKPLWDFEIQTDHLITTGRPDLVIVNQKRKKKKRTCRIVGFTVSADNRAKLKEIEKRDKARWKSWCEKLARNL